MPGRLLGRKVRLQLQAHNGGLVPLGQDLTDQRDSTANEGARQRGEDGKVFGHGRKLSECRLGAIRKSQKSVTGRHYSVPMTFFKGFRADSLFRLSSRSLLGLYACFITIDVGSASSDLPASKALKFTSIIICALLCVSQLSLKYQNLGKQTAGRGNASTASDLLLVCALCLTTLADFLLGVAGVFLPGVAVFALVHVIYVKRHLRGIESLPREAVLALVCGVFAASVWWISAPLMKSAGLLVPSILYIVPLAASLYAGCGVWIRSHFGRENKIRISIGISLFFAVDIGVAYFHALPQGPVSTWLGVGIWALYLPSQWMLALSASRDENTRQISPGSPSQPLFPFLLAR